MQLNLREVRNLLFIAALFLAACNPLRHYQKIAADPFRNSAERAILRPICLAEWPLQIDTPRLVRVGVDSSDYAAAVSAYNEILDQLIKAHENDGEAERVIIAPVDSARIIRNFLKWYKPMPIIKTEYLEVPVRDTRIEDQRASEVAACRAENDQLRGDLQKAKDNLGKRTSSMWIAIGSAALLLLIVLGFLIGKIRARI